MLSEVLVFFAFLVNECRRLDMKLVKCNEGRFWTFTAPGTFIHVTFFCKQRMYKTDCQW
jgi:hypothetical protein